MTSGDTRCKQVGMCPFRFHQYASRNTVDSYDTSYQAPYYLLTRFPSFSSLLRIFSRRLIGAFHRSFSVVRLASFLKDRCVKPVNHCRWALRRPSAAFATFPLQKHYCKLTCLQCGCSSSSFSSTTPIEDFNSSSNFFGIYGHMSAQRACDRILYQLTAKIPTIWRVYRLGWTSPSPWLRFRWRFSPHLALPQHLGNSCGKFDENSYHH